MTSTPDVDRRLLTDPRFRAQVETLRLLIEHADRAMQAEGIPPEVRRRVTDRILLGAPNPAEAIARQEAYAENIRKVVTLPGSPPEWAAGLLR